MTKIMFFDLDGTLRETKSGKAFINEPDDQQPIEGTQKALAYYQSKGFICIGITNQGGVAAGHKSLEDAIKEQLITLELFPELSEIFFCPNYGGKSCWQVSRGNVPLEFKALQPEGYIDVSCRKPVHGMLLIAAQTLADLSDCWMISDQPEDQQCAEAAGVNFVWASVMHSKFSGSGMQEVDTKHLSQDVLLKFLAL